MSGPYLWNRYSQRLQIDCAAWSCGLILHCCLPSNSLRYWTKVRGIAPRSHTGRPRTCLVIIIIINIIIIIVTQPLYESRMYWVHDPAPPTSRRPVLEFADTPAPVIAKESPGALSTQPKHKKSRRRRRRRANRTANQNAALHSDNPVTPNERWANENSASQRATRPKSAANDLPEMRSTPVEHRQSFHSSHLTQPPISATNENSEHSFGLDHCEFSGLYKPAQTNPRQDLLTFCHLLLTY